MVEVVNLNLYKELCESSTFYCSNSHKPAIFKVSFKLFGEIKRLTRVFLKDLFKNVESQQVFTVLMLIVGNLQTNRNLPTQRMYLTLQCHFDYLTVLSFKVH